MTPAILYTGLLAADGARLIMEATSEAIAQRGIFRIALSGGHTPAAVYR